MPGAQRLVFYYELILFARLEPMNRRLSSSHSFFVLERRSVDKKKNIELKDSIPIQANIQGTKGIRQFPSPILIHKINISVDYN